MDCTAVKYDESSKSCELGSAEKLDRGTNRVSSILITKLFQVVDNVKGDFHPCPTKKRVSAHTCDRRTKKMCLRFF